MNSIGLKWIAVDLFVVWTGNNKKRETRVEMKILHFRQKFKTEDMQNKTPKKFISTFINDDKNPRCFLRFQKFISIQISRYSTKFKKNFVVKIVVIIN